MKLIVWCSCRCDNVRSMSCGYCDDGLSPKRRRCNRAPCKRRSVLCRNICHSSWSMNNFLRKWYRAFDLPLIRAGRMLKPCDIASTPLIEDPGIIPVLFGIHTGTRDSRKSRCRRFDTISATACVEVVPLDRCHFHCVCGIFLIEGVVLSKNERRGGIDMGNFVLC